jgi:glycolate oxidase iron-sulfur subunit
MTLNFLSIWLTNTVSENEISALADECVQCAICLPHCPTYQAFENEGYSPRGRIALIKAYSQGLLQDDAQWSEQVDSCLSCGACEQACPANVQYERLYDMARALRTSHKSRPVSFKERVFGWILGSTVLTNVFQRLWPGAQSYRIQASYPLGSSKKAVRLLMDCSTRIMEPQIFEATAFILNRLGYSVELHTLKDCCGGWWAHTGQEQRAKKREAQLRMSVSLDTETPLLVLATGCHYHLARSQAIPVKSVYAFIADNWDASLPLHPISEETVHLHSPCTSRGSEGLQAFYALLKSCGASISPLKGRCCGAGGAMAMTYPQKADVISRQFFSDFKDRTGMIFTPNPACQQQIQRTLPSNKVQNPLLSLARALGYPK